VYFWQEGVCLGYRLEFSIMRRDESAEGAGVSPLTSHREGPWRQSRCKDLSVDPASSDKSTVDLRLDPALAEGPHLTILDSLSSHQRWILARPVSRG
jgi:hypothetical protein